jgi:hypothetical protein
MITRIYTIPLVTFLILLQGCFSIREAKMLKEMNGKVPASSKWIGGKDGGVWIDVKMKVDSIALISVFNDYNGKKIADYYYKSTCLDINEKRILKALQGCCGPGLWWNLNDPITKCLKQLEK